MAVANKIVAIHIPHNLNDGTPVAPEVLTRAKVKFSEWFGGYSTTEVCGGWVFQGEDPSGTYQPGQLVEEKMHRLFSFAGQLPVSRRGSVRRFASQLATELGQEAIYVEISNADVQFVG